MEEELEFTSLTQRDVHKHISFFVVAIPFRDVQAIKKEQGITWREYRQCLIDRLQQTFG